MVDHLVAGRYRLRELLGAGSMAQVWLADDTRLQRQVAVKLLDLTINADPVALHRFRREAIAAASLNHPSVVAVFDAGTDEHQAYLVMELIDGQTLADVISIDGIIARRQALGIAIDLVTALAEAHIRGLVHRDVKPANVMLTNSGHVTLLDFGIAELTSTDATVTKSHSVIGSAAYMSPEQALGHRVGPASDMYAMGCLLTTMLTGYPPFTGDTAIAVATAQVGSAAPALSDRVVTPAKLDRLVSRLLAKNPTERPTPEQTLTQLRAVLEAPNANLIGPHRAPTADRTAAAEAVAPDLVAPAHATKQIPSVSYGGASVAGASPAMISTSRPAAASTVVTSPPARTTAVIPAAPPTVPSLAATASPPATATAVLPPALAMAPQVATPAARPAPVPPPPPIYLDQRARPAGTSLRRISVTVLVVLLLGLLGYLIGFQLVPRVIPASTDAPAVSVTVPNTPTAASTG